MKIKKQVIPLIISIVSTGVTLTPSVVAGEPPTEQEILSIDDISVSGMNVIVDASTIFGDQWITCAIQIGYTEFDLEPQETWWSFTHYDWTWRAPDSGHYIAIVRLWHRRVENCGNRFCGSCRKYGYHFASLIRKRASAFSTYYNAGFIKAELAGLDVRVTVMLPEGEGSCKIVFNDDFYEYTDARPGNFRFKNEADSVKTILWKAPYPGYYQGRVICCGEDSTILIDETFDLYVK